MSLKEKFARSFKKSNFVLLCPLYLCWRKKNSKFSQMALAKLISKLSKTQVILVKSMHEIRLFFE